MEINNGGPAFPCEQPTGVQFNHETQRNEFINEPYPGMTLRDYFAAKAMQGWLASFGDDVGVNPDGVAIFAYEVADAMVAARTQEPK